MKNDKAARQLSVTVTPDHSLELSFYDNPFLHFVTSILKVTICPLYYFFLNQAHIHIKII